LSGRWPDDAVSMRLVLRLQKRGLNWSLVLEWRFKTQIAHAKFANK
jgi:3-methyladenine DNA glycosylase Tag